MKIHKILSISISLAILVSGSVFGATIKVPDDHSTIQQAIDAAVDGDTVLVAQGTYSGPIFIGDKTIAVRSESGSSVTTIEGILDIAGASPTIDGFKLTNGPCQSTGGHGSIWGGSSPTFINCQIVNGCAAIGGGYDIRNSSATFIDCEFFNNEASSEGGALYIDESSSVTLTNCNIKDNEADGNGGGIYNRGTLDISYSSIVENDGDFGSGIINYGTMSLSSSTISDNGGNQASSGGIENAGIATLIDCTVQRNFGGEGAGIGNTGDITLMDSNISDNDGSGGIGGILNFGSLTLINSTISGNKGFFAGGIDNVGSAGANVSLTNCTVSNNSASSSSNPNASGGIVGSDSVKLQNTILALNTAPLNPDCSREVVSLDNNLIGDPTGCTIRLQANDLLGDPGLGAFTVDGTPGNGHLPLLSDSRAIDAGNNNACLATDQLENPRVDGDGDRVVTCDIGAVEFQGIVLINDLVTFEPDPLTYSFMPDIVGCQEGAVGKFSFDAKLTNISEKELSNFFVEIDELTNNNLLFTGEGLKGEGDRFRITFDSENVALNADVQLKGAPFFEGGWGDGQIFSKDTIVDGIFLSRGQRWDQGPVWWDSTDGEDRYIKIDLDGKYTINSLIVQADDNDAYKLYYWDLANNSWQLAWDIPNFNDIQGTGMVTRPNPEDDSDNYFLSNSITTDALLIRGTMDDSDRLFSVSEIQAFTGPENDYFDGILSPEEYINVPFTVCLKNTEPFRLFINVVGSAAD